MSAIDSVGKLTKRAGGRIGRSVSGPKSGTPHSSLTLAWLGGTLWAMGVRYLDPRNDIVFKRVFGEHAGILRSFLNALLPLPVYMVAFPLNFLMVRYFLKRGDAKSGHG